MKTVPKFLKENLEYVVNIITLISLISILSFAFYNSKDAEVLSSTTEMEKVQLSIDPELDFSRFEGYLFSATNIPETPTDVTLNLSLDMGDDNECWDFQTNGTCSSEPIEMIMDYNPDTLAYERTIYPDQIYPEIFFASSAITWGNEPLEISVRRNEYQIFHFINNFTVVDGMYLWVEFNAVPLSEKNSTNIEVYLVEKGHDISFFNSNWKNSLGVELIGTKAKDSTFHHTHSVNSSHHLVRLATDINGKVGNNTIDISEDFWIVLYSNSPNNARGWNLRYQPATLCDNNSTWYTGNFTRWTTTLKSGCPDAHIHISRNNVDYIDSVESYVSATYDTGTYSSPVTSFNFTELPNLPPNSTAFQNPIPGSIYSGELSVQWDPSSDPNTGDTIAYNTYLTKKGENPVPLLSDSISTDYTLDTTLYEDGEYILTGEVCDSAALCTDFAMDGVFSIDNITIPETLTSVMISSTNSNSSLAKSGDTISLTFEATGTISQPQVDIYSGGDSVFNTISLSNTGSDTWVAEYIVSNIDSDGQITFEISSSNVDKIYYQTTDLSNIIVDVTSPITPVVSLESGSYQGAQTIELSSSSDAYIKYVLDQESISCATGTLYESEISISQDSTVKAIACDSSGNTSTIGTYTYTVLQSLESIGISSSNSNTSYAKRENQVTLSFTSSGEIEEPEVLLDIEGESLLNNFLISTEDSLHWLVQYTVDNEDPNGLISFDISAPHLYTTFTETTDLSRVTIDTEAPTTPLMNISEESYETAQNIILCSNNHSVIRYTLDGSIPTCNNGFIYIQSFTIFSSKIVKAVACDVAGNQSTQLTSTISIFPDSYVLDTEGEEEQGEVRQEATHASPTFITPVLKIRLLNGDLNPIPNTTIIIHSKPQISKTDDQGIAIFRNIPLGCHMLTYQYEEIEYSRSITIESDYVNDDKNQVEIIDVVTEKDYTFNKDLIFVALLGFLLIIFGILIVKTIRKKKEVDK